MLLIFDGRVAGDVEDKNTVRQIHLIGRKPDAALMVHQFEHFRDGFAQFGIDPFELAGLVTQRGMGIFDDPQDIDSGQKRTVFIIGMPRWYA